MNRIVFKQLSIKEDLIPNLLDKGKIHREEFSKDNKISLIKKQNNTYQWNGVLKISDPKKED